MDDYLEHVLDQFEGLGELRAKRMFGGVGLYCDDLFFALIGNGVLYMKVDDRNRADYEAAGSEPFRPYEGKPHTMNYWELPSEVLERREDALAWGRKAVEVARRAKESKGAGARASKKRKKAAKRSAKQAAAKSPTRRARAAAVGARTPIAELRNLGPKSAKWLRAAGIETRADLERVGAVGAYRAVAERERGVSLNLLYALEAALLDVHWTELPPPLKDKLRESAGR